MDLIHCSQRKRNLVNILLITASWVSGPELSDKLGISDRTVRKEIIELNDILKQYNGLIISERGKGYRLECGNQNYLVSILNNGLYSDEKENRICEIAVMLAGSPHGIDLYDLEEQLFISRTTLEKELRVMRDIMSEYYPTLTFARNKGSVWLSGPERFLRLFLNYILMKSYHPQTRGIAAEVFSVPQHKLEEIKTAVLCASLNADITLNDRDLMDVVSYLLITQIRIENQCFIDSLGTSRKQENFKELDKISEEILLCLFSDFDLSDEVYILEMKQLSVKFSFLNLHTNNFPDFVSEDDAVPKQLLHVVTRLIHQIKNDFSIDLSNDEDLYSGLIFHFKVLLKRYKYHQHIGNPVLDIIKKDYPFVFELSISIYQIFFEELNIRLSENELGYVAAHIGAAIERRNNEFGKNNIKIAVVTNVTDSYTRLFTSRISTICGSRGKIIGAFPSYKTNEVLELHPDLIISTCTVNENSDIPILPVSLSITKKDRQVLEETFQNIQNKWLYQQQNQNNKILDLFREELFETGFQSGSSKDSMYHMAKKMEENGYVFGDFYDGLIEREKIASTVVDNMIAIPHPMNAIALNSVIGVLIHDRPIPWEKSGYKVQIIFVVAMRKSEKAELKNFFHFISLLMDDKRKVKELLECNDYPEFLCFIDKILKNDR